MTKRTITFEIDDEIEGHLLALAEDWEKDPVALAKALFVEELMGQTSGSRGVPHSRRYWYRNSDAYFTTEEKSVRTQKTDAFWQSAEGQALKEEQRRNLESMNAAIKRRKQGT
jgi:hypothetical protein